MSDGKILIMGVGGCGSGFIWGLLMDCGLETYGINEWMRWSGIRESEDPKSFNAPKVIKHLGGFLCNLNEHIDRCGWEVEHIFFAVSSFDMQMDTYRSRKKRNFDYDAYVEKYRQGLGRGLIELIERDHPFTIVRCPRSLRDPKYCYDKLKVVLGDLSYEEFEKIHAARVNPEALKALEGYE